MPRKLKTDQLNRLTISQYHEVTKFPLVVILDNVRSLYNVGSFFRTCDAFRVKKLILCGITGTPPHREISKTAIGAEKSVEWEYFPQTISAVNQLKQDGYWICAIEQAVDAWKLGSVHWPTKPTAFIFGNEIDGVAQEVLDICDACIEIPQAGTKHSINVSVAAGVVLWEYAGKKLVELLP